jgi:hypothetical protein
VGGPVGKVIWLDPTHGNDNYSGDTPAEAKATLSAAYNLTTNGNGDTVAYIAGSTGLVLSAGLVWSNSYTNLVGICAPTRVAQRARIFQLSTLTGASPLISVTGSGCLFKNLYIFQGVNDATSLINVSVSGSRNVFDRVHFAGGGHVTQAVDGGASLYINGGSENLFSNCTIGVDTIAAGTGMTGLLFPATGGAARNTFEDCKFLLFAGHAGATFVELMGNSGMDRATEFINCAFENLSATSMTQAIAIAADFDPANKRFILRDCTKIGVGTWDAADHRAVYGNMNAVTGADLSGTLVQLIS